MAALPCWRRSLACSPFSRGYSPTAPMKGRYLRLRWRAFCELAPVSLDMTLSTATEKESPS